MKRLSLLNWYFITSMVVFLSSCDLIEGIFKAGIWVGVIGVAVVIGLIVFVVSKIL